MMITSVARATAMVLKQHRHLIHIIQISTMLSVYVKLKTNLTKMQSQLVSVIWTQAQNEKDNVSLKTIQRKREKGNQRERTNTLTKWLVILKFVYKHALHVSMIPSFLI